MSTQPLRHRASTRAAAKARPASTDTTADQVPSRGVVARRLAALHLDKLPWFRGDVDLTPPDGGQEVCGAPVYSAPNRRK